MNFHRMIQFSFLASVFAGSVVTSTVASAADYPPNIDYGSKGDFLAKRAVDQGRAALSAVVGPLLVSIPEDPGSSNVGVGNVQQNEKNQIWDLSDLTNPRLLRDQLSNSAPLLAHGSITRFTDDEAHTYTGLTDEGRESGLFTTHLHYNPDAEPQWQAEPSRLDKDNWGVNSPWSYSMMFAPLGIHDVWSYNNPIENYTIQDEERYERLPNGHFGAPIIAEWNQTETSGVTGFSMVLGNLLIVASDQLTTGMAIYDMSGLKAGETPRLVSLFNPDLVEPDGNPTRIGGYWVEPYGANKLVWSDRQRYDLNSGPYKTHNSLYVVDFTDPVNPALTCEIYFKHNKRGPDTSTMYVNFQDQYAFTDNVRVDLEACEAAYQGDQNIDDDEYAQITYTFDDAIHSCDSSQYFRPLGQVGVFGGYDSHLTQSRIEYSGGTLDPEAYYHIYRNGAPSQREHDGGFITNGLRTTLNLEEGVSYVPAGTSKLQVGDELRSESSIFTITAIDVDERINEQGMCFIVTSDEPDTKAPYVSGHRPLADQTNVPIDSYIHLHIPETLRSETLVNAFTVTNTATGQPISFKHQLTHTGTVSIWPDEDLVFGDKYRVDVVGIQDFMGNAMVPYSFSFTTGESLLEEIDLSPTEPAPTLPEALTYFPNHSGNIACEAGDERDSIWVTNPDNNSVSLYYATTDPETYEVTITGHHDYFNDADYRPTSVGKVDQYLAITYGNIDRIHYHRKAQWGTSKYVSWLTSLDYGDNPVASVGHGDMLYVALYGSGEIAKIDTLNREIISKFYVGPKPKAMALTSDGSRLLVTRFISDKDYAEVYDINTAGDMSFRDPAQPSIKINKVRVPDDIDHGSGVPNYLRSIVIGPNDDVAYITANKANIDRGLYLSGQALDDDNTIRPMIATIDLVNHRDTNIDPTTRQGTIDLDNSADPSGITILPDGITLTYAFQGNNVVAMVNTEESRVKRLPTGLAPQSMCATPRHLYVKNRTDRTVSVIDIADYMYYGISPKTIETLVTVPVDEDVKTPEELQGLQLFYHARMPDMSPEGYISCASCHDEGGHDGMTWDLTHMGEGLRNTISLRGSSGTRFGHLHWTANFDEVQDFEIQLERLNGGDGLIAGKTFTDGVSPLIHITAGDSQELDALAAYVSSLGKQAVLRSPYSCEWGGICGFETNEGKRQFHNHGCLACHTDPAFRDGKTHNMGTVTASSGLGSGLPLTKIRTPSLIELWDSAPYLHNGSAATLKDVFNIGEHANMGLDESEVDYLVNYLLNIDRLDFIEDDVAFVVQNPTPDEPNSNAWVQCAIEGRTCTVPVPAQVRYGKEGFYAYQQVASTVSCSNDVFGNPTDVLKQCDYLLSDTADYDGDGVVDSFDFMPADASESADTDGDGIGDNADPFPNDANNAENAGWAFCANEWQRCDVPVAALVRYGDTGQYFYRSVTGSADCNNDTFGSPINTVKHCDYLLSDSADYDNDGIVDSLDFMPADASESADSDGDGMGDNSDPFPNDASNADDANWVFCAHEWQRCDVSESALVRYGKDGQYHYQHISDSVYCNNDTFGIPTFVAKQCDYLIDQ